MLGSIIFLGSSIASPKGLIIRPNNPIPTKILTTPPFVIIRSPTLTKRSLPKITIEVNLSSIPTTIPLTYLTFCCVFKAFKREGDGINTANSPKLAKPKSRAKATPSLTRITTPKDIDFKVTFLTSLRVFIFFFKLLIETGVCTTAASFFFPTFFFESVEKLATNNEGTKFKFNFEIKWFIVK